MDGVLSLANRYNQEVLVVTGGNTLSAFPNKDYLTPDILAVVDISPDESSVMVNAAQCIVELLEAYLTKRKKASPTA